ncbi:MAG: proton-conducting transporter membrane subunit [Nitrospira sp.]|nr:proton-conducting transporter membrane subunit [Nitrospira sp.]
MTLTTLIGWLLVGVPFSGALAGISFWSNPARLKYASVVWAVASLGAVAGLSSWLVIPPEGFLPLYLLPVTAIISLLAQPAHADYRTSLILTLAFLGLGLCVLVSPPTVGSLALILLFLLIAYLLYHHHSPLWPMSWWGIGAYVFGAACMALSLLTQAPLASVASLAASAVLLPLVPFHNGHLAAVTRLPGNLPSFMAVLLPIVGLHGLASALLTASDTVAEVVGIFGLAGAIYGAAKALVQTRVRLLLAYGSLSFFAVTWWFSAATRMATPRSALLVGTVGLATSGLLVAWQIVRTRYGDDVDPQAVSGLASGMPQFAVLLSVLALAAMGLPPFGVFAGFMGLLLSSPFPSSIGLIIILAAWLAASWYIMQMAQRLLFGQRRPDLRYTDVLRTEFAALVIVALALLGLGLAPVTTFAPEESLAGAHMSMGYPTWNR